MHLIPQRLAVDRSSLWRHSATSKDEATLVRYEMRNVGVAVINAYKLHYWCMVVGQYMGLTAAGGAESAAVENAPEHSDEIWKTKLTAPKTDRR